MHRVSSQNSGDGQGVGERTFRPGSGATSARSGPCPRSVKILAAAPLPSCQEQGTRQGEKQLQKSDDIRNRWVLGLPVAGASAIQPASLLAATGELFWAPVAGEALFNGNASLQPTEQLRRSD